MDKATSTQKINLVKGLMRNLFEARKELSSFLILRKYIHRSQRLQKKILWEN